MKKIRINIDKEMQEEIKERSEKKGISVSKMARELIESGVELDSVRKERDRLERELEEIQESHSQKDEENELIGELEAELRELHRERDELKEELRRAQEKHSQRDDGSDGRTEELEAELREVRKERDKLEGRLKAREETLEDMREFRNNAVGSFADVAGRVGGGELTEEGVVVTDGGGSDEPEGQSTDIDTVEEKSDGWWIF